MLLLVLDGRESCCAQLVRRTEPGPALDHERLDVYRAAVALDALVCKACRVAPRGHAAVSVQALRASASVVLNIAEGNGRDGLDRARCLRIARGSANELDAALTLMHQRGTLDDAARAQARALCVRVVAMLVRWIQSLQASRPSTSTSTQPRARR